MQSFALEAEGVLRGDEAEQKEPDLHCPEIPGFLNYWMEQCQIRQRPGGGCEGTKCRSGEQVRAMLERVPPRNFIRSYSFRTSPTLKCKCGAPALAEDLMQQWGVETPRCIRCNRRVRAEEKRRKARQAYRRKHGKSGTHD
jgi:hypothetical protein